MLRGLLHSLGLIAPVALFLTFARPAAGTVQLLQNGGFEAGTSFWSGTNFAASGCEARSGSGALNLTLAAASSQAIAQQQAGVAPGQGPYNLSGYAKLGSGTATGKVSLRWLDPGATVLLQQETDLSLGASYAAFSASAPSPPPGAASVSVRFAATSGPGNICVDDVSLEGPAPVTPTPTATPTAPPTATSTRTPTSPPPTKTPVPPSATKTLKPPTPTRTPGASPSSGSSGSSSDPSAGPSSELLNGGFENGLAPWLKFGGELHAVSSPAKSGSGAGALSSATTSTKWAYQVVSVEPGGTYEFSGFVQPAEGVAEAYLRISWYESGDGSGRAIGSVDSTEKLRGPGGGYSYLTTESVEAPARARSVRVRVMLAPFGSAAAVIYLDDFSFGPSEVAPRSDAPLIAPSPEEDAAEQPQATTGARETTGRPSEQVQGIAATVTPTATRTLTLLAQSPTAVRTLEVGTYTADRQSSSGPGLLYALIAVLALGGFGAALWYAKRWRRAS